MGASVSKKPIYLRGIPSELVREAKAAAARRGITLAGFVADTLARAIRAPLVAEAGEGSNADDLGDDMRWYERQRERLAQKYPDEFVAIIGQRVVDHDPEFEPLAERVFAREGKRDIFMPRVSASPAPLRIRSPRQKRAR